MFCKKGILKNLVNFTGKHLRWSHFLVKFYFWGSATLLKNTTTEWFAVKFSKFLRTTILKNICEQLWDSNTDVFIWILWIIQEHLLCWASTNNWFWNTSEGSFFNKVASLTATQVPVLLCEFCETHLWNTFLQNTSQQPLLTQYCFFFLFFFKFCRSVRSAA